MNTQRHGASLAIGAAVLFGISPVLAKLTIGDMPPALLASLLYLGAGLGLFLLPGTKVEGFLALVRLSGAKKRRLLTAVALGGIAAPLCLCYAIRMGSAFEISLGLNLETAFTTLLAWLAFREPLSPSVWTGKAFLLGAGALAAWVGSPHGGLSFAGPLVAAACFCWAIDNNLTRDIEEAPAETLAVFRSFCAGTFNLALAFFIGVSPDRLSFVQIGACLAIGALSYGLSLVFFIKALRKIGASRTALYFATAPFVGMIAAIGMRGEHPGKLGLLAAGGAAIGMLVLWGEKHLHSHRHDAITHCHEHRHDDEHHGHSHEDGDSRQHLHTHSHATVEHAHDHLPDVHHRHQHS